MTKLVADPDIPYMGVEGGLPDPEIRVGGGAVSKKFLFALSALLV